MQRSEHLSLDVYLLRLFQKPYPYYYNKGLLYPVAGLFVLAFCFNFFLTPFNVYLPEHKWSYTSICLIHGFLLISVREVFWDTVRLHRRKFLIIGLLGFSLMLSIRLLYDDSIPVHFTEALFKVTGFWSWILTLIGLCCAIPEPP